MLTIVIFGASGDLTARKLVPALFQAFGKGRLPADAQIVGVSRSAMTDDQFRAHLINGAKEAVGKAWNEGKWKEFAGKLHYVAADAAAAGGLTALRDWLRQRRRRQGRRPALLPGRSPRSSSPTSLHRLGEAGLNRREGRLRRLVIEKPFGRDLATRQGAEPPVCTPISARTRSTASTITSARRRCRTSWCSASPTRSSSRSGTTTSSITCRSRWPRRSRSRQRGSYYDKAGVLRDMFQNHLLQVLTMVAMEAPARFEADPLRNEKIKVLDAVDGADRRGGVPTGRRRPVRRLSQGKGGGRGLADADVRGVELGIDNWRWQGVPFYLRSGKAHGVAVQRGGRSSSCARRT